MKLSARVVIPFNLTNKVLNNKVWKDVIEDFTDKVAVDTLSKVQEYGEGGKYIKDTEYGIVGQTEPWGGAPHWQGPIFEKGHYSGYLSEQHHINHVSPYHKQIVCTADFVEGVIYGYSTNWFDRDGNNIIFPANPYHKRSIDNMIGEGHMNNRWRSAKRGRVE